MYINISIKKLFPLKNLREKDCIWYWCGKNASDKNKTCKLKSESLASGCVIRQFLPIIISKHSEWNEKAKGW